MEEKKQKLKEKEEAEEEEIKKYSFKPQINTLDESIHDEYLHLNQTTFEERKATWLR